MTIKEHSSQLALFPELFKTPTIPSISTLPEFDLAIDNLIKLSDLGAFISVNVQGVEKSYSIHLSELEISSDFLKDGEINNISPVYHLFPAEIRHRLRRFTYDVKNFFNQQNSLKTPFGYFLYRPHFRIWAKFVEERKMHVQKFLEETLGGKKYSKYFLDCFKNGYQFISTIKDETAPWEFKDKILMQDIREIQHEMESNGSTLHTLDQTFPNYPAKAVTLKMHHFPLDLKSYIDHLSIRFAFKSIHLEYLTHVKIESMEDVKKISEMMIE